jgi:VanZ family protein
VRGWVECPEVSRKLHASRGLLPSRFHYLLLAVSFTLLAIYGSLVPLHFRPLPVAEAIERFRQIPFLNLRVQHRADWVANILLFIPMGFLWLAVLQVDRPRRLVAWITAPLVVVACVLLSISLEFTQIWFPPRTVSQNDVLAETIGGISGVVVWLAIGPVFTLWVRTYSLSQRPQARFHWLLQAYAVGIVIYALLPLDLTLSPVELLRKYRQGKIELMPFSTTVWEFKAVGSFIAQALLWVPVGMLAVVCGRKPDDEPRSIGRSIALGTALVCLTELTQLIVYSRFSSTTDVLVGAAGVATGVWMMRRWHAAIKTSLEIAVGRWLHAKSWPWLVLSGVHAIVIVIAFCRPIQIAYDPVLVRARLANFWQPPFASLYYGSEFNAVTDMLRDLSFFAPLGAFLAKAVLNADTCPASRRTLLLVSLVAAAGLATGIELFQVFLPSRFPDLTDVLLCTLGAALGMAVVLQLNTGRGPLGSQSPGSAGTHATFAVDDLAELSDSRVLQRIALALAVAFVWLVGVAIMLPLLLSPAANR